MKQDEAKPHYYLGRTPCCGIFCGNCPIYTRTNNKCLGAAGHCEIRRCGIYQCCIEKKGYRFCYECPTFPCSKFKRFAAGWLKLGQNLYENQKLLKALGEKRFADKFNSSTKK